MTGITGFNECIHIFPGEFSQARIFDLAIVFHEDTTVVIAFGFEPEERDAE